MAVGCRWGEVSECGSQTNKQTNKQTKANKQTNYIYIYMIPTCIYPTLLWLMPSRGQKWPWRCTSTPLRYSTVLRWRLLYSTLADLSDTIQHPGFAEDGNPPVKHQPTNQPTNYREASFISFHWFGLVIITFAIPGITIIIISYVCVLVEYLQHNILVGRW